MIKFWITLSLTMDKGSRELSQAVIERYTIRKFQKFSENPNSHEAICIFRTGMLE